MLNRNPRKNNSHLPHPRKQDSSFGPPKILSGNTAFYDERNANEEVWPDVIPVPKNNWVFDIKDWTEKTPLRVSRKAILESDETIFRAKAVMRAKEFGKMLNLQFRTILAALSFIHRFYMFEDMSQYDYKLVVATAIFVATKAEESLKPIKAVATVLARINKVNSDDLNDYLWKTTDAIKLLENKFLVVLRFDLVLQFPLDVLFDANMTDAGPNFAPEKVYKECEWFFKSVIFTPSMILFNEYEIAAFAVAIYAYRKGLTVPSLFFQKTFGVGLSKLAQLSSTLKHAFVLLTERKLLTKITILEMEYTFPELVDYSLDDLKLCIKGVTEEDCVKGEKEAEIEKVTETNEQRPKPNKEKYEKVYKPVSHDSRSFSENSGATLDY